MKAFKLRLFLHSVGIGIETYFKYDLSGPSNLPSGRRTAVVRSSIPSIKRVEVTRLIVEDDKEYGSVTQGEATLEESVAYLYYSTSHLLPKRIRTKFMEGVHAYL